MALQGTIETFALPEVLRLLGSGAKTGRLRLSGDRGSGSVWIDGGTGGTPAPAGEPKTRLFAANVGRLMRH